MGSDTVVNKDPFAAGRKLGLSHLKLGMWIFIASEASEVRDVDFHCF